MSKSGNIKGWFTVNGRHIPIMEGETKHSAFKRAISGKEFNYKKAKKDYDKKISELEKTYGKSTKSMEEHAVNMNMYNKEKDNAFNKMIEKQSKSFQKDELRYKKVKNNERQKDASSSINAKYDKKQEELYNRLGKKDTIAARQDYDREYNRLERARKKELDNLNNKVKTNSSTKSIPDSAMSGKTSKERRHNLQKYFYDQPKGSKIKVNGITYTKQDNSPGGLWKSKDGNHFSEDLIKEYAHYRKK
jgi:hypothetical protein